MSLQGEKEPKTRETREKGMMQTHNGESRVLGSIPMPPQQWKPEVHLGSWVREQEHAETARELDLLRQDHGYVSPCQMAPELWDGMATEGGSTSDLVDRHLAAREGCSTCMFMNDCAPLRSDPSLRGTVAGVLVGKGEAYDRARAQVARADRMGCVA